MDKEEKKEYILKMEEFAKKQKDIDFEKKESSFVFDGELIESLFYTVSNIKALGDLELIVRNSDEIDSLEEIIETDFTLFDDFFAINTENKVEVLLSPINVPYDLMKVEEGESKKIIEVRQNYLKNELSIKIEVNPENVFLPKLTKHIRGFRFPRRRNIILTIENLKKTSQEGIARDVRSIIYSVLFDLEYTYSISFETVNIQNYIRRGIRRKKPKNEIPETEINLIHKKYISELIEYYHIGEKVDYLPFKFICYFHIIEYFSDKSAYHVVSDKLKDLLLKPDFHEKTDKYVGQAINLFKKENDRYTSDKIKIERVLRQFVDRDELSEYLKEYELIESFEKDLTLECTKDLKLPGIDFSKEQNFFMNLTKRIYSLRCSIVHSNPDFDDTKAVPFIPSPTNMDYLRTEIEMIMEIARMIIIGSKE